MITGSATTYGKQDRGPSCLRPRSRRNTCRRCRPISTRASLIRRLPDCTRSSASKRLNSRLLIDNTPAVHPPGSQNPREVSSLIGTRGDILIRRLQKTGT
jgi:hypothetical protein